MNVNKIRCWGLLAVVVVLSLAACAKRQAADSPADIESNQAAETTEAMETMVDTASPTVEGRGPETPRAGDDKVAVTLPGLPVGRQGDVDDEFQAEQCVLLGWLGSTDLPDGVSVVVTGVHFDPPGVFEEDGSGCGGARVCAEPFAFTSAKESCSVLARARESDGVDTGLLLSGYASCASRAAQKCRDVAASNSGQSIPLTQPYVEPDEQPDEQPDEGPDEEEPLPPTVTTTTTS
jgi:hypothetical protein